MARNLAGLRVTRGRVRPLAPTRSSSWRMPMTCWSESDLPTTSGFPSLSERDVPFPVHPDPAIRVVWFPLVMAAQAHLDLRRARIRAERDVVDAHVQAADADE